MKMIFWYIMFKIMHQGVLEQSKTSWTSEYKAVHPPITVHPTSVLQLVLSICLGVDTMSLPVPIP